MHWSLSIRELNLVVRVPNDARGLIVLGDVVIPQGPSTSVFERDDARTQSRFTRTITEGFLARGYAVASLESWGDGSSCVASDDVTAARHLIRVTDWLSSATATHTLPLAHVGIGRGSTAALTAAAYRPDDVDAVIVSGDEIGSASSVFSWLETPTLLLVGTDDGGDVQEVHALRAMYGDHELRVVPGATRRLSPKSVGGIIEETAAWLDRRFGKRPPEGIEQQPPA